MKIFLIGINKRKQSKAAVTDGFTETAHTDHKATILPVKRPNIFLIVALLIPYIYSKQIQNEKTFLYMKDKGKDRKHISKSVRCIVRGKGNRTKGQGSFEDFGNSVSHNYCMGDINIYICRNSFNSIYLNKYILSYTNYASIKLSFNSFY